MECLVLPLHDKLEEWKRIVIHLDKEHSKGSYIFKMNLFKFFKLIFFWIYFSRVQEGEDGY